MGKNRERAKTWWSSNTKNQKIWFIISAIITGFFLLIALLFISAREIGATEISDDIFGEGVSGWHWLASSLGGIGLKILGTISIACIGVIISFLLNFLIGIFTWKGKRSKTIGSLIKSLIKYIIVIVSIGFILSAWGVDVASIIAGLGIVTLIIGLGCQSLISDIVSGLFVVFDDFFDVGDIVVIDGFRGTISEIGLRSTKLTDWAGNIKAINNSQITTVTNLSRLATSIAITFYVDREEDI
nr:mechanosensitive ion channel family protein [Bacilli bacterium]